VGSLRDPVTTDLDSLQDDESEIDGYARYSSKSRASIIRRPQNCFDPGFQSYLSGYVDGEGCFTVSVSKRSKMITGWELRPSFSVSQNQDRAEMLYQMAEYFACGTIRPDRSDRTLKYEVRSLEDIVNRIIPHFDEFPILSNKRRSYQAFRSICLEMVSGNHLSMDRIQSMLVRAEAINQGRRKYRFGKI
jgi:LAGLIDADG endonuclease